MIVSHVKLRNWRNFVEVDADLGERVIVVGPNASGKSNLLDVFRFLRDIVRSGGGLQHAVGLRGGLSKIRCLAARRRPDVEIEISLVDKPGTGNEWKYAIAVTQEPRGHRRPMLKHEKVWRDGEMILDRPDTLDETDEDRLIQTHLEQVSANKGFRQIADFLSKISYLHLVPQLLRFPDSFSSTVTAEGDPFGRTFLDRLANKNEKTRNAWLRKLERALKAAVPQFERLTFEQDKMGKPHLEAWYKHWRSHPAKQQEDQFSDGTLRLIALLWSLLESESLLLLEEPELSLNAHVVSRLPALIHRVMKEGRRQVILSTHSIDLLSDPGIGPDEILILCPGTEGTVVEMPGSRFEVRQLMESGIPLSDVLYSSTKPTNVEQLRLSSE
jgi:predicted ATPase